MFNFWDLQKGTVLNVYSTRILKVCLYFHILKKSNRAQQESLNILRFLELSWNKKIQNCFQMIKQENTAYLPLFNELTWP